MSQEFDRPMLIHQAVDLLIRSMRRHHRGIERFVSDTGLHRSQRMILLFLSQMDAMPSQRELATRFDISPACVARSLKTLANEGYISRCGDADDLRRNHVSITDKGLRIVQETRKTFDQFDQLAFEGFEMEEIRCLISLLSRLQDNLRQYEDPATEPPHPKKGSVSL